MKEIYFSGLGLRFKINNVALSIFGIDIYWYAIFIVLAFSLAILLCKRDDGKYNIKFENILEIFLLIIPASIISARLYFVIFKLDYYIQNPAQIINLRDGGLAIYGGIIGAAITIAIYCKAKRLKISDALDYLVPYLALGQAIGRWGNFFNAEAHGTITDSILRMGIIENGIYKEVHPTFLYESICCLLIFALLFAIRNKRKYQGQLTYMYLFLYGCIRSIIEELRTDSLMIGNFRVSQILSIILCITFGIVLIYKKVEKRRNE